MRRAFSAGTKEPSSADSPGLLQPPPPQDDQRAAVQIQAQERPDRGGTGQRESTTFTVKNLGTQVEEFRLFVTGPEWIVVEPAAI